MSLTLGGEVAMKVLLVEDATAKAEECISYLNSLKFEHKLVSTEKDAKKMIKSSEKFDLVLLDMELVTSSAIGASQERHSGIRILNCMKRNRVSTPVILVTAYWDVVNMKLGSDIHCFYNEQHSCNIDDSMSSNDIDPNNKQIQNLKDLHLFLCHRYKNYVGAVEYSKVNSLWKRNLSNLIAQCFKTYNS